MHPISTSTEAPHYDILPQDVLDPIQLATHEDHNHDNLHTSSTNQASLFGSTDVDENSFGLNSGTARNDTHENADAFPNTPSGIGIEAEKGSAVAEESSIPNNEEISHYENTTTHRPKKWGFFVTNSGQTRKRDILEICVHAFMAVAAIMVLVFAILAARVDSTYPGTSIKYTTEGPFTQISPYEHVLFYPDTSTEDVGYHGPPSSNSLNNRLLEIAKIGPTIIPILFAGILGSTMRLIARWKAEKGSSLGAIEILIGCRSLSSTMVTLFSLGTIGAKEFGLLCLWAVSPLAGQASLRIINLINITETTVLAPWVASNFTSNFHTIEEDFELTINYTYALYNARAGGSGLKWCTDDAQLLLPSLPSNESLELPECNSIRQYLNNLTSLVGQRILGPLVNLSFYPGVVSQETPLSPLMWENELLTSVEFEVGQYEFNCPSISGGQGNESWTSFLGPNSIYGNQSALVGGAKMGSGFFVDTNFTTSSDSKGPQSILFGSFFNSYVTVRYCFIYVNIRNITYECGVSVDYANFRCKATKIGIATLSTNTIFRNHTTAAHILGKWPQIDSASPLTSSYTERFLADGLGATYQQKLVNLSEIDNVTFARRLTTVFNTWVQTAAAGRSSDNESVAWMWSQSVVPMPLQPLTIIQCHWIYFAILTLTSLFLLSCCIFSIWVHYQLSTPDILGYISSSTIENPHVSLSTSLDGSLDGLKRTKLLKNVKVQVRDMQAGEDGEKFALTNKIKDVSRATKMWFF